jgi:hypothetical protein
MVMFGCMPNLSHNVKKNYHTYIRLVAQIQRNTLTWLRESYHIFISD